DQVGQPVEVEVGERRTPALREGQYTGRLGRLDEGAVGPAEEEVARVARRVVRLAADVALRDEQVDEPVVVDVGELRVPGGRRQDVAARERSRRVDASREGDVAVGR